MSFKKNFFSFFGSIMLAISLLTIGFALTNFFSPVEVKNEHSVKEFAFKNCKSSLRKLKLSGEYNEGRGSVNISTIGLENWSYDLGIYSMAISECKGFNIAQFCQGDSCVNTDDGKQHGTTLTLVFQKKI